MLIANEILKAFNVQALLFLVAVPNHQFISVWGVWCELRDELVVWWP
jgi:hypothetical protein